MIAEDAAKIACDISTINPHRENFMLKTCIPLLLCLALLISCSPTVQVAAPEKPITINLNVKIEHEIKVQVEKELDDVLSQDSGLF